MNETDLAHVKTIAGFRHKRSEINEAIKELRNDKIPWRHVTMPKALP